jgi:hypothetical protein
MRPDPTVLERLQVAGLRADLVVTFRDIHRKRKAYECRLCEERRRSQREEGAA